MAKAKTRAGDRHAGTAKTIRFTEDELQLLEALKAKAGGTYANAIAIAARPYLGQNKTDWAAELRRLASELEATR